MPRLYSGIQIIKSLERAGFRQVSQKGSHVKLRGFRGGRLRTVIVPKHKEVAQGTFQSILNQASITKSEFEEFFG